MKKEMVSKKGIPVKTSVPANTPLFNKSNYKLMVAGLIVMAIGFILMSGGRSNNPQVFEAKEIFSFRRITLAPILIVAGLVIEVFAIMKKSKEESKA